MALFQPTNITPDLKGGVKNGAILIPENITTPTNTEISWTVNGNSKMTAYKIDFFQNTAASTQTGTTGKITLNPAFSAISADGTVSRFTATVAWSLISGAYAGTGTLQGKFKITMWWGSGANDYVEQKSLSVFEVSKCGSVTISTPTGYGGFLDFDAVYTPPAPASTYGDVPLNWVRWEIFINNIGGTPIHDSGKIWNATSYAWSPPPLSPADYAVRFTAEGANGAEYSAFDYVLVSNNDVTTLDDMLTVVCDHEKDGVKISIQNTVEKVESITSGNVSTGANDELILSDYWAQADYDISAYSGSAWSFIWHGKINGQTSLSANRLFTVNGASATANVYVTRQGNQLSFTPQGNSAPTITYSNGDEFWIIFTTGYFDGNLTTGHQWLVYKPNTSGYYNWSVTGFTELAPRNIHLSGNTTVYGFQLGFGKGNSGLAAGMSDHSIEPSFAGPKVQFPYESYGADAAWLPFGVENATGELYRQEGLYFYGAPMTLVGKFPQYYDPSWIPYIIDYAAVNGQQYQYVVTSADEDLENESLSKSGTVTPCFWNWLLIEAKQDADNKDLYEVQQVFRLIGNVSSGTYGNGGNRTIEPTFTQYSAVLRSTQNRRQGTLTGLIGYTVMGEYFDTNLTEQNLRGLSRSKNQLFLRDRRGNFMKIALAGEISMSVNDNSAKQEITASIPWIETGSTAGVSVYDWGYIDNTEPEE